MSAALCPECSHWIRHCICDAPMPEPAQFTAAMYCDGCNEFRDRCTCEDDTEELDRLMLVAAGRFAHNVRKHSRRAA